MPGDQISEKSPAQRSALVVGGGLAGLAAAVALESVGARVTLLETRRSLGGRAGSFEDAKSGEILDNCQHVLLGCCTNLINLYARLGVAKKIRYASTIHFLDSRGKRFDLWATPGLPAPLHLGPAMASFSALTLAQRAALVQAMLAMLRLGRSGRAALEGQSFGQWLQQMDQPEPLVQRFYDPVLVSALNEQTLAVGSKYAIQVFQDAMLFNRTGYVLGLPACPLAELYARPPCQDVRLSTRVEEIMFDAGRAVGVTLHTGRKLTADAIVLAANYHAVLRWVPEAMRRYDARFAGINRLESVPILGAHLWFDQPVMTISHAALMEGPLQWLFRKDVAGRVVHGVISAARDWVNVPHQRCLNLFTAQIKALFPQAAGVRLLHGVIVIEKRATFSPRPGVDALRPMQGSPSGGIANLFLAGDYTRTDWPATMEGAVRSGYLAAQAVLRSWLPPQKPCPQFLMPDLPMEFPADLLTESG
ncbi:MAG: NAD(P)-binding protein [Phycisphaerae bacterium]|nr:NAD(P)-binding protein [Phycisphaerae bacterium]